MPLTINVNNLSLCHKGSNGISTATVPDVCKTPSPGGPVPIPYPNIAMSSDLVKGTTTVTADGGNMCANYGSEFFKSTGDEPGTIGGVVSSTFMKEATWITFSFDVKLEGKGACRLTDKMFHNHQNTVNLSGELQALIAQHPEVAVICAIICKCDEAAPTGVAGQELKQQCVSAALQGVDDAAGNRSTIKPEINYNMTTSPPSPIMSRSNPLRGTEYLPGRTSEIPGFEPGAGMVRRPDAVIVRNGNVPPTQDNLSAVVEIKFPPDSMSAEQRQAYEEIAGTNADLVELSPQTCECQPPKEKAPVKVPELSPLEKFLLGLALIGLLAAAAGGEEATDPLIPVVLTRLGMAF